MDHVHLSRSLGYRDNELYRSFSDLKCCFPSQNMSILLDFMGYFGFLKSSFEKLISNLSNFTEMCFCVDAEDLLG